VTPRVAPPASTPFLVVIVAAAMAFLAVLALEAGRGAARSAGHWRADLTGVATVRLEPDADARAVAVRLTALDGVAAARALPRDEVAALLLPWIGDIPDAGALPLPGMIDVTLATPPPRASDVEALLPEGGVYDDHRAWTAPLIEAVAAFERLIAVAVGLSGVALAAMVAVAARAGLAGAADTVRTLRLLGARDGFIAACFDRGIALRALAGAALGTVAAAVAVRLVPSVEADPAILPWLALVPLASGALAWATARLAIVAILRGMP
jgi:cell division transport system permease protein